MGQPRRWNGRADSPSADDIDRDLSASVQKVRRRWSHQKPVLEALQRLNVHMGDTGFAVWVGLASRDHGVVQKLCARLLILPPKNELEIQKVLSQAGLGPWRQRAGAKTEYLPLWELSAVSPAPAAQKPRPLETPADLHAAETHVVSSPLTAARASEQPSQPGLNHQTAETAGNDVLHAVAQNHDGVRPRSEVDATPDPEVLARQPFRRQTHIQKVMIGAQQVYGSLQPARRGSLKAWGWIVGTLVLVSLVYWPFGGSQSTVSETLSVQRAEEIFASPLSILVAETSAEPATTSALEHRLKNILLYRFWDADVQRVQGIEHSGVVTPIWMRLLLDIPTSAQAWTEFRKLSAQREAGDSGAPWYIYDFLDAQIALQAGVYSRALNLLGLVLSDLRVPSYVRFQAWAQHRLLAPSPLLLDELALNEPWHSAAVWLETNGADFPTDSPAALKVGLVTYALAMTRTPGRGLLKQRRALPKALDIQRLWLGLNPGKDTVVGFRQLRAVAQKPSPSFKIFERALHSDRKPWVHQAQKQPVMAWLDHFEQTSEAQIIQSLAAIDAGDAAEFDGAKLSLRDLEPDMRREGHPLFAALLYHGLVKAALRDGDREQAQQWSASLQRYRPMAHYVKTLANRR